MKKEIVKKFKEAFNNGGKVNYEYERGFIYYVGGILSKLDRNGNHHIAINGRWVKI